MKPKFRKQQKKTDPDALRRTAEKKLAALKERSTGVDARTPDQVIHELQVHQIELEMQNEALRDAHLALETSWDKYIDLYEFAPVGYLTLTKNAVIEEGNLTGAALLGTDRRNLLKTRFRKFVEPADLERWDQYFISVLRNPEKQRCDLILVKGDGSRFNARLESLRIDQDRMDPVVRVAVSDITMEKQAEEALRYNALIISEVHDAIVTTKNDEHFTITGWNPGAETVYGWKQDEVIGRGSKGIFQNEYPGQDRNATLRNILSTGMYEGEVIQSRKDGTRIVVDARLVARRNSNGEITDWISVNRDITGRKRAEDVIGLLSEERRILIDNMPAMIMYKDTKNTIMRVNPAVTKFFGASATAIEGKSAYELFPEEAEGYYVDDLEVMRSGIPKFGIVQQMPDATGAKIWVRTDKIPLKDEGGRITGLLVFAVDITGIKQAEDELIQRSNDVQAANEELSAAGEELRRSETRLTASLKEKEVLLAEIHHRVKNNLAAFVSLLSLEGTYEETESGRKLKNDLQNRARSMALIHETLYQTGNFSKVDMEVYLSTLVSQLAGSYARSKEIRSVVDIRGVDMDLARATTAGLIVNELITNSFKYAFPPSFDCQAVRGEPCTIRVSLTRQDGSFLLSVADNGLGMPAGFDPLSSKTLGLKLVNFLARHQLRAETSVSTDKGTEFVFRLDAEDRSVSGELSIQSK
jgi:PAS domain S-box-containing protein